MKYVDKNGNEVSQDSPDVAFQVADDELKAFQQRMGGGEVPSTAADAPAEEDDDVEKKAVEAPAENKARSASKDKAS